MISDAILSLTGVLAFLASRENTQELIKSVRQSISRRSRFSESSKQQIDRLSEAYRREELVLVLGAGVSASYSVPTWPELLQGILIEILQGKQPQDAERLSMLAKLLTETFEISPLIAARYLRLNFMDGRFEETVRSVLYARVESSEDSELVKEIRQLAAAPGKSPNLDSILTYNFDDIVETALRGLEVEIPFQVIDDIKIASSSDRLPIYHVHGYLPRTGPLRESKTLTLSEDAYHSRYSDTYDWSSLVQINKFRERTCIFLGTSFSDPNLRRLLDVARQQRGDDSPQHVLVRRRWKPDNIQLAVKEAIAEYSCAGTEGDVNDPGPQIDELADQVIRLKQEFEETDAESFGVSTLWVDEYEQIPGVLRAIRGDIGRSSS